ncbi:hypothetical protein [Bdellovibrio sp. NC01]|uniref:hypothetical protein n=1 Tax=Bdellovibrio sp. NC01 TaxID=2220073 RepID=UPI00115C35E1|nr:hypothetical protein [Bdellovibrio sp. NC01]
MRQFIISNNDSAYRWRQFKNQSLPSVFASARVDSLTPFSNTPFYSALSEEQKNAFYKAFIQFNAEALILLELVLYEGVRSLITQRQDATLIEASRKLMQEEKDHSKAFIRFLQNDCPGFASTSYLLRHNKKFKNSFLWLARTYPVALALPAAKVEAYTVFYGKALQNAFSDNVNSWSQLNVLHLMDESLHIGYEFDMYELELSQLKGLKKVLALASTLACIFYLQICFLIGCSRMVKAVLHTTSFMETTRWTLRLGGWILREFAPYRQTRSFIKNQFQSRKPSFGNLFGFMYK